MKHWGIIISLMLLVYSCEYMPSFKTDNRTPVAKVFDKELYTSDIEALIPVNISSQDSILFVKNFIDTWAKQQLLLHHAEINLKDEVSSFEKLVSEYRSTLYINSYKEALVLNTLDTAISKNQLEEYYSRNKENFKLNEELVQFKYIYTGSERSDKKTLVKLFKSKKKEDLEELQSKELEYRSFNFNDSIWVSFSSLKSKIDYFKEANKNKVLKKEHFIQKEDSLGLYLITIKDVLNRNDIAPIEYVTPTIKQIILQKRKLELLRQIEVDLLNDAIKNQDFEKY